MEYKSNSNKSKEMKEDKDLKPVTKGNVVVRKEPVSRKFADTFLAEDMSNVTSYVIFDVIVPAITDMVVDGLTSGVTMLFKGSPTAKRRNRSGRNDYTSYSRDRDSVKSTRPRSYSRDRYGIMDIVYETRGDAIEVRDCLQEVAEKYHMVSVADYYELSKVSDQVNYTDRNYGWSDKDLNDIAIMRDRDGYRLDMPKPEPFD